MAEADTTMEARLAAITASLRESRALLASCAQRLAIKEQGWQETTTASLSTMATSSFVLDPVREQPETKPSSPSLVSTHRVMDAGALHADAVVTPTMPIRCSTLGSAVNVGNNPAVLAFPTSGMTHLAVPTLTGTGDSALHGASSIGMNTPAGFATHIPTSPRAGIVDGVRAVTTDRPRNNSFPRFDGTNPGLWREKCLEFFMKFNICKPFWTTAARLHMDGKAKEWFEAYRLRQVVGDWSEFMDAMEANFGVRDLPPSTTMLGATHPGGVVYASGDISPETPKSCLHVSLKEVMVTSAEPKEPTLVQLAERIQLQFAELKLVLASEYEERKKIHLGNLNQLLEPTATDYEEVLTHVGGISLFLEHSVQPTEVLFSKPHSMELEGDLSSTVGGTSLFPEEGLGSTYEVCDAVHLEVVSRPDDVLTHVGGFSLFLEFDLDLNIEFEVLSCVGDCSIFEEPSMGGSMELFDAPLNADTDKVLNRGVGVPSKGCKLLQLLSHEMQQHGTNCATHVPWDPGGSVGPRNYRGCSYGCNVCSIGSEIG